MQRCPVCRARLNSKTDCRRCGSDLHLAIAMEKKAQEFFQQALQELQSADKVAAKSSLQSAVLIHNKPLYQHLLNCIAGK